MWKKTRSLEPNETMTPEEEEDIISLLSIIVSHRSVHSSFRLQEFTMFVFTLLFPRVMLGCGRGELGRHRSFLHLFIIDLLPFRNRLCVESLCVCECVCGFDVVYTAHRFQHLKFKFTQNTIGKSLLNSLLYKIYRYT